MTLIINRPDLGETVVQHPHAESDALGDGLKGKSIRGVGHSSLHPVHGNSW